MRPISTNFAAVGSADRLDASVAIAALAAATEAELILAATSRAEILVGPFIWTFDRRWSGVDPRVVTPPQAA